MPGTSHERPALDKVLATALGQTARDGGPDCLDAEELAAYYERSLGARELARTETHVASCRACQERLVALVLSEPAPAPAPAWWRAWVGSPRRWAWAAPALAAGIAVAVWVASQPASAPVPELTVASKLAVPEQDAARQKQGEDTSTATADIAGRLGSARSVDAPPVGGKGSEPKDKAPKPETAAETPAAGAVADRVALADERAVSAEGRVAKEKVAEREAAAPTERRADIAASQALASMAPVPVPPLIPAPGGRVVWRIDAIGTIARSNDGGTTWVVQATAGAGWTAGLAVSDQVCWVVGRGGAVLRTDDGERWVRVTPPADVDLVQIQAIDALRAQVTASDGRRFETTDGGRTWVEKGAWHLFR